MSKHHKISICMLCVLILLLCIVGCQEKKRTPQEMSDDELRIAVLSEVNLSEMWYYSNEDYTLKKESFGGKFVNSKTLEPYRNMLEVEWKRDAGTGRYEYPINAKSEEWTLLTESGKRAVCKIPQTVLDDITDDELVDLVLKYPLLVETVTEDEFFRGFEKVSEYFEALKIMHEKGLLQKYTKEELEDKFEQSPEIAITFVENYLKTYGD